MINSLLFTYLSRVGVKCPLRVTHFCTFRCNLSCSYCGIWKARKKEMTTEQVKRAMKEFAVAGTVFWTFTGGEPLLRKDIGELVNYAKGLFPIVSLTTNGVLLKDKINEVKNVNYFTISLDGPKEVNDYNRGKGSFEKALEGIKTARRKGKDVVINAVISKLNVKNDFEGIKKLIKIASDNGCRMNFTVLYRDQFNRNNKGINNIWLSDKERINALNFIKKEKKRRFGLISFSNPCIERIKNLEKWKICYSGKLFCELLPDGTVVPCLFKEKEGIDGLKYGFVNAFNKLPIHEDCFCINTCYNELNCIFSLNPKSLAENLLKYVAFVK